MNNSYKKNKNVFYPNVYVIKNYSEARQLMPTLITKITYKKFCEIKKMNSAYFLYVTYKSLPIEIRIKPISIAKFILMKLNCHKEGLYLISSFGNYNFLLDKEIVIKVKKFINYVEFIVPGIIKYPIWEKYKKSFDIAYNKIKLLDMQIISEQEKWILGKIEGNIKSHNLFVPSNYCANLIMSKSNLVKRITKLYNSMVIENYWLKIHVSSIL